MTNGGADSFAPQSQNEPDAARASTRLLATGHRHLESQRAKAFVWFMKSSAFAVARPASRESRFASGSGSNSRIVSSNTGMSSGFCISRATPLATAREEASDRAVMTITGSRR
jgi:hypothetical protein